MSTTNLFGQEPYALRGENDVRIAALEAALATITLGDWPTWTPVITQSNTPTQAIAWARYVRVGRLIIAHFRVTFSAAGTINNNILLTGLPATAADGAGIGGSFRYFDTGNTNRAGTITGSSTTAAKFEYDGFGNSMGNGDFVIASGDAFQGTVIMQAAS